MDVVVQTPMQMLQHGLKILGYDDRKIARVGLKKNLSRFRTCYVGHPRVYATLFGRLQTTGIPEARLDCSILGEEKTLNYFFMSIYFLANYPTEEKMESDLSFHPSDRTFRTHAWAIIKKIYLLHKEIIVWPDWWGNPDKEDSEETKFIITVDGTHCAIDEPNCETFEEQRKYYSHKFKSAGLDYEVGLSIFQPKCVWIRGPYPAGKHDITIFCHRLMDKILASRNASGVDYMAIGDRGYRGEADLITVPNSQDTEAVREFKGRALSRQETFNSRLKNFNCLNERFRHHEIDKHKHCFYACAVIVQLQMENGSPLFSV